MGTRYRITFAVLAVLVLAVPAAAQGAPQPIVVAYVDGEIDGPISRTLAAYVSAQGRQATAVDSAFVENHGSRLVDSCVVAVGRDADVLADSLSRQGVTAEVATGADRNETAVLAAEAVHACGS